MRKFLVLPALLLAVLAPTSADALSCIAEDFEDRIDNSDIVAIVEVKTLISSDTSDPLAAEYNWKVDLVNLFKGSTTTTFTLTDMVWPGGADTPSRLNLGGQYLVFLNEDFEMGLCSYPRSTESEPLTAEEQAILGPGSAATGECAPYECNDGSKFARCDNNGSVINYFMAPCATHGGEVGDDTYVPPVSSSSASSAPMQRGFADITEDNPLYQPIMWAQSQRVIQGYSDGTFRANASVNRAEFLKILLEAKNINTTALCRMASFPDASLSEWFGPYVQAARCYGLVSGYPDGTYRPSTNINFVEAAKITVKVQNDFDPNRVYLGEWYEPYVVYLEEHQAVPSTVDYLDQFLSRGEMVEMMWLLAGRPEPVEQSSSSAGPVACTMDAMQCPDGSYVGRVGPDCEFEACPGEDDQSIIDCGSDRDCVYSAFQNSCRSARGKRESDGVSWESSGSSKEITVSLDSQSNCLISLQGGEGNPITGWQDVDVQCYSMENVTQKKSYKDCTNVNDRDDCPIKVQTVHFLELSDCIDYDSKELPAY